jgi:hypothetical protein
MPTLRLHNQHVSSPYQLIGRDENALTFALGHCLSQSQPLLKDILRRAGVHHLGKRALNAVQIELQCHEPENGGFTDIELYLPGRFKVIFEAKIGGGWPHERQLQKYEKRLQSDPTVQLARLVVLVARPPGAARQLPEWCGLMRWSDVRQFVDQLAKADPAHPPVWWLDTFLKEVYDVRLGFEEEVWVVPLGRHPICEDNPFPLIDVPRQYDKYLFPTRFNPRKTLFIAFRYDGKLQAVHRIVREQGGVTNYDQVIPGLHGDPHIECTAYHLGRPIPLARQPRTGPGIPRNTRTYCDLDLLLTSETISDAVRLTKERRSHENPPH